MLHYPVTANTPFLMRPVAEPRPAIELLCVNESTEVFEHVIFEAYQHVNNFQNFINPLYVDYIYIPGKSDFCIPSHQGLSYRDALYTAMFHPCFIRKIEYEVINYPY